MFVYLLAACLLFVSACADRVPGGLDEAIRMAMEENGNNGVNSRSMGNDVLDGLDMRLTQSQYDALYGNATGRSTRRSYVPWTNGVIPYEIWPGTFNRAQIKKIELGMANWEKMTCIRFKKYTGSESHRIVIKSLEGCWSYLGMTNQESQDLSLQSNGCFWRGTVEHELGHAIGLVHEHQRPNRDQNIRVTMTNVDNNMKSQLTKYNYAEKYGLPYDYTSVMHYGQFAFSISNGRLRTIEALKDDSKKSVTHSLGKALWASFYDVQLVNKMYNCDAGCRYKPKCRTGCFVNQHCKCFCKSDMPPVPCVDADPQCRSKSDDSCWRYQSHNEIYCRKRCGMCAVRGTTVAPSYPQLPNCPSWDKKNGCGCKDSNQDCAYWARNGECRKNPGYMSQNCRKSCRLC